MRPAGRVARSAALRHPRTPRLPVADAPRTVLGGDSVIGSPTSCYRPRPRMGAVALRRPSVPRGVRFRAHRRLVIAVPHGDLRDHPIKAKDFTATET